MFRLKHPQKNIKGGNFGFVIFGSFKLIRHRVWFEQRISLSRLMQTGREPVSPEGRNQDEDSRA
jgi:hypothetical protein